MKSARLRNPAAFLLLLPLAACSNSSSSDTGNDYNPVIVPSEFSANIDNPLLPLQPGRTFIYESPSGSGNQDRDEYEVTRESKVVMGVTCVVIHDRVYENGNLVEDTFDWFAQHQNGDVWYFGEDSKQIENGQVVGTDGSWEAGVDGAKPGIVMMGAPAVGQKYRQEFYEGEAEDMAETTSLAVPVTTPYGSWADCLKSLETTALEPDVREYKYYAPGIGVVREDENASGVATLVLTHINESP